jgi:hypothetical protein
LPVAAALPPDEEVTERFFFLRRIMRVELIWCSVRNRVMALHRSSWCLQLLDVLCEGEARRSGGRRTGEKGN